MDKPKIWPEVADAGAGGQVLLDEATFHAIKERLEELGTVNEEGLRLSKLGSSSQWLPWR